MILLIDPFYQLGIPFTDELSHVTHSFMIYDQVILTWLGGLAKLRSRNDERSVDLSRSSSRF